MKKLIFIIALLFTLPGFGQSDTIKTNNPTQPKVVAKSGVFEKLYGSRYGSGLLRDTLELDSGLRLLFDDGTIIDRGIDTTNELATKDYVISEIDSLGALTPSFEYSDSVANTKGWVYPFPDSFSYRPPFNVLQNPETGEFLIDPNFDLRSYANIQNTGATYWVSRTGNDTNAGTEGSPLRSVAAAIQKTDVSTVNVTTGYYYNQHSWRGITPTNSIEIIGVGDSVILTSDYRDLLTFVADGPVYKAYTDTVPSLLWDRKFTDQFGDAKTQKLYASRAQVDTATVGAWYYNAANDTLYVRLRDFRAPDSLVSAFTPNFNIRMNADGLRYYFENITLFGAGLSATNPSGTNGGVKIFANDLTTRGSGNTFDGTSEVILFNSSFAKMRNGDLLNYDPQNGVTPDFVEYNCEVYNTMDLDYTPGGSDQASTAHNGCRGIRINSTYKYTVGQCIADVNGCESWLLNCTADSAITASSANYLFGTGATFGRAWMQDCKSYNIPASGYDVNSQGSQMVRMNNFVSNTYDFGTSGQIDSNYHFQYYGSEYEMFRRWMSTQQKLPAGLSGYTTRYNSGGQLVSSSFFTNTGTAVGIGGGTGGVFSILNNTSTQTVFMQTTVSGVEVSTLINTPVGNWRYGTQDNHNGGAFILTVGGIASGSALYTFGRDGTVGWGTTSIGNYKFNLNGSFNANGSVSIGGGTAAGNANASAALTINSTTQGILPSRMTGAQAEAIATPGEGLFLYATDGSGAIITSKGWWGWDGATWVKFN